VTQRADVVGEPTERPLRELLPELWENSEKLVRQEFELALSELDQRLDKAKTALLGAAVGGAVLYAGVLACVAAVILLLAEIMVPWLAALIVGAVAVGGGVVLLQKAKKDVKPENLKLERSAQSIRRDVQTFEEAVK
jgi:predicted phosphoribosyltransferase